MFTRDPTADSEFCFDFRDKLHKDIDFYDAVERETAASLQNKIILKVKRPTLFIHTMQSVARYRIQSLGRFRVDTFDMAQGVRIPFRSLLVRKR